QLSLSRTGFWLRQSDEAGNHSIIHAKGFATNHNVIDNVMILFLAGDTKLARRIDAAQAELKNGVWEVHDGTEWEPGKPLVPFTTMDVGTNLTLNKIQESFASPETMSFWELPGFIRLLDASGFSSQRHRLYSMRCSHGPFSTPRWC